MTKHNLHSCLEWLLQQPNTIDEHLNYIAALPSAAYINAAPIAPSASAPSDMARLYFAPQSALKTRYNPPNNATTATGLPTPSASVPPSIVSPRLPLQRPAQFETPAPSTLKPFETPMTEYGDDIFDIDEIEQVMDMDGGLGDYLTTSSFGEFGAPEKLWTHTAAARVEPLLEPDPVPEMKRGRKRKSDEYVEDWERMSESPRKQLSSSSGEQSFKDAPTWCEESPRLTQIKVGSAGKSPRLTQIKVDSGGSSSAGAQLHGTCVPAFKRSSSRLSSSGKAMPKGINASPRRATNVRKHIVHDSEDEDEFIAGPSVNLHDSHVTIDNDEQLDEDYALFAAEHMENEQSVKQEPVSQRNVSTIHKERSIGAGDQSQQPDKEPTHSIESIRRDPSTTGTPASSAGRVPVKLSDEDKAVLDRFLQRPAAHAEALRARLASKLKEVAAQITSHVIEDGTTPPELRNAKETITSRMRALEEIAQLRPLYTEKLSIRNQLTAEVSRLVIDGGDYESVALQVRAMKPDIEALESKLLTAIRATAWNEDTTPALPNQSIPRTPARTDSGGVLVNFTQNPAAKERSIPSTQHQSIMIQDDSPPVNQTPMRSVKRPQQAQHSMYGNGSNSQSSREFGAAPNVSKPRYTSPALEEFDDEFDDDAAMLDYVEEFEQPPKRLHSTPSNTRRPPLAAMSNNIQRAAIVEEERKAPSEEQLKFPWSQDVMTGLRKRFHLQGFRHNQLEAINTTLDGHDAFVLMPTGGGKSLCYQLPSIIQSGKTKGVTIVISPLLSLMQDQVNHLQKLKVQAFLLNGECTRDYRDMVLQSLRGSQPERFVQLLYVTPEMLTKSQVINRCLSELHQRQKLARIVIDEAHCVSQWGHDFRPDYKSLGEIRRQLPGVPVMALTATATENVKLDTMTNLGMKNCKTFTQSFNRPNLSYTVRKKLAKGENLKSIANTINNKHPKQCGIVYCLSRKKCEDTAKALRETHFIKAAHYHAGMQAEQKTQVQNEWQAGKHHVVVATIAFGMGIDKPDVRFVIHETIPKSLEGYYQETGRAGRDGKPSECYLYYGYGDTTQLKRMIDDGDGSWEQKERQKHMLRNVLQYCENTIDCRRCQVLAYFNEHFQKEDCNASCDNCQSELVYEMKDFSEHARNIIGLVRGIGEQRVTILQCVDLFCGKSSKKSRDADFEDLEGFGEGADLELGDVERLFYRLVAEDGLEEYSVVNAAGFPTQYLKLGAKSREFVNGQKRIQFPVRTDQQSRRKSRPAKTTSSKKKKGAEDNQKNLELLPGSTMVSSPAARKDRRPKARQQQTLPIFADESEGDDSDSAFEPVRQAGRTRPSRDHVTGPAITVDMQMADLSQAHQNVITDYVKQARERIQAIMLAKGLRQSPISDTSLRDMFIHFPKTSNELKKYEGMNAERTRLFGTALLKLVKEALNTLQLYEGDAEQDQDFAAETIELSDDEPEEYVDSDQQDEEDESSRYFSADNNVAAFNDRMSRTQTLQSAPPPRTWDKSSQSRAKGKGKVFFRKRASAGAKSKSAGTATKKRRSTASRTSGGSQATSGPGARKKTSTSKGSGTSAGPSIFDMMPT